MASFFCACCDDAKGHQPVDIFIEGSQRYDDDSKDDPDARQAVEQEREELIQKQTSTAYVVTPGENPRPGQRAKVSILISRDEGQEAASPNEADEPEEADGVAAKQTETDGSVRRSRLRTVRPSTHSSLAPEVTARASLAVLQSLGMDVSTRRRSSVQSTAENAIQDSYEFLEILGQGGFGMVHKSRRKKDGKVVAIKCIRATATNPAVFEKELDQARKLRHPNIVRLLEAYRDKKMFYLVMELCSGGDLLTMVADRYLRCEDDRMKVGLEDHLLANYAWQMLSGVAYLHYHYIVHRDIKPENYMRATSSPRAPLKLIDLGLSTTLLPGETLREVVGTMTTIAPEVYKGQYNEKCDVWSIGITLYISAVCMEPWLAPSGLSYMDEDGIRRSLQDEGWRIPYDERRWKLKQPEVKELVELLLQRDPKRRPRAQEVLLKNRWLQENNKSNHGCCGCL